MVRLRSTSFLSFQMSHVSTVPNSSCPLPRTGNVLQNPVNFRAGEVGVDDKAGLIPDGLRQALFFQRIAVFRRSAALPDDGSRPLIGDADGGDVVGPGVDLAHGLDGRSVHGGPDLVGVVLHPAGFGEDLGKLPLGRWNSWQWMTARLPSFIR